MRAPRRVPWVSKAELNELYDLIFSPDADERMKVRGLERMSVYISCPSCPAFMQILYGLIAADLLPAPRNVVEAQSTRLSCAMAIVRLINGMVDPLQTGPYAKPISHLAATLQIPPSLISLRHRATHEDLPPLALLRSSIIQCISYLHTYSFLPLLAESSSSTHPVPTADRASRLIARYKRLTKDRIRERDVDENSPKARELRKVKRALEVEDTDDLVHVLCSTEGLVPLSRKKRPGRSGTVPTEGSRQLWVPLLGHLVVYHPTLVNGLAKQIVSVVLEAVESKGREKDEIKEQLSFRWSLAVWLLWMWRGEERDLALAIVDKQALWASILPEVVREDAVLRRLASALAEADPSIASGWFQLESMLPRASVSAPDTLQGLELDDTGDMTHVGSGSLDDALGLMQSRMAQFEEMMARQAGSAKGTAERMAVASDLAAPGWRRLTIREWKPCPIGVPGCS